MTPMEIIRLGIEMRAAQKVYFRDRTQAALLRSKELERRFDREARRCVDGSGTLFGTEVREAPDQY